MAPSSSMARKNTVRNHIRILTSLLISALPLTRALNSSSATEFNPLPRPTCPLPSKHTSSSPWSNPPHCIHPAHKPDAEYCVYTSREFRGGQGISILASVTEGSLLQDLITDDGSIPSFVRDHGSSRMRADNSKRAYEVREIPGKGKGLIATKHIPKNSVVLVDFVALLLPVSYDAMLSSEQRDETLDFMVESLPEDTRDRIWGLDSSVGGDEVLARVVTNAFGVMLGEEVWLGLFTENSRINHHCMPNSLWRFSASTMAAEVIALRDINPGEEITHSYIPDGRTSTERKTLLRDWGFTCTCSLCTASPAQIEESDTRRTRLVEIQHIFVRNPPVDGTMISELIEEVLELVEREDLVAQLMFWYELFCRAYLGVGDVHSAVKFARLSEGLWIQLGGVEHDGVGVVGDMWRDIRKLAGEVGLDAVD